MNVLGKLSNRIKLRKLEKRKEDFNTPGSGGKVAYLLNTKYGEPVLVFHDEDREGSILNYYLESVHFGKTERSKVILLLEEDSLLISDIQVLETKEKPFIKKYGKGYGSVFMKFILCEAERSNCKEITGNMAFEDEEHKKRQIGFYSKHGFDISEDYKLSKKI